MKVVLALEDVLVLLGVAARHRPRARGSYRSSSEVWTVYSYMVVYDPASDPEHEEHESRLRWAGGQFEPEACDPAAVKFADPKKRWRKAFER